LVPEDNFLHPGHDVQYLIFGEYNCTLKKILLGKGFGHVDHLKAMVIRGIFVYLKMRFTIEAASLEEMCLIEEDETLRVASMIMGALVPEK